MRVKPSRREGFTLIELLSVMAVMVMITTVVVASGFGMRRGATYNAARQIPNNVLEYARQRACLDGRKTAVLFENETGSSKEPAYVVSIFQTVGVVDGTDDNAIVDKFTDIATNTVTISTLRVFNLSSGKSFPVKSVSRRGETGSFHGVKIEQDDAADGKKRYYQYPRTLIEAKSGFSANNWTKGSAYGFEIADRQSLPKNFKYTQSTGCNRIDDNSFFVVFNPDGTFGDNGGDKVEITVSETVGKARDIPNIKFP